MLLGGISEWIGDMYDAAASAVSWVGDEIAAKLDQWNKDVSRFRSAYAELQATPSSSSERSKLRMQLIERGQDIVSKVDWIQSGLASVSGMFGLSGLGALPLLVPAVIVAAIIAVTAVIYKWTDEVAGYLREERLVASGVPRTQAQAANQGSGGLFGDVSKLLWPLALLAGGALLLNSKRRK